MKVLCPACRFHDAHSSECRRYAPHHAGKDVRSFPKVDRSDWCGEGEAEEEKHPPHAPPKRDMKKE